MMCFCETCKRDTRHKWNDYASRFECIRKTEKHGWRKWVIKPDNKEGMRE